MPKTLVIDNDPELEALCAAHEGTGHESAPFTFVFAHDDDEVRDAILANPDLDVALVSIDTPNSSGLKVFHSLGDIKVRVPRVALSAAHDLEGIRSALRSGAADFVLKPVDFGDLANTLMRIFRITEDRRKAWRTEAQLSAIRREIDIAGDIQKRILPTAFPYRGELEIAAQIAPAKDMSGDFFDYFEVDEGRLGCVIADVSGKGIPAAFVMAVARTMLRATAAAGVGPAECLRSVNIQLCRHQIPAMFVSALYLILDPRTWTLTYCNAGHLPPYLIPGNGWPVRPLAGGESVVLGVDEALPFEEETIALAPGDAIFCYTDGLTEAFNSAREQFGEDRLEAYLARQRGLSAAAMARDVVDQVKAFTAEAPQSDDITSLVIRRH